MNQVQEKPKLRDLIDENMSLEGLDTLLEKDFEVDYLDIPLIVKTGGTYRKAVKKDEQAPETKIFGAYCYHRLKEMNISKDTVNLFLRLKKLFEQMDTRNSDEAEELLKELAQRPDLRKVYAIIRSAFARFFEIADEYSEINISRHKDLIRADYDHHMGNITIAFRNRLDPY